MGIALEPYITSKKWTSDVSGFVYTLPLSNSKLCCISLRLDLTGSSGMCVIG